MSLHRRAPLAFIPFLAAFAACSGSVAVPAGSSASTGSGGAPSTTASSSSTATTDAVSTSTGGPQTSSSSATSTGTGGTASGTGGADNGSFATAQPINVNVTLMENLPASDSDYYVFTGTKGQALDIEALAQYVDPQNGAPFDASYIDTVISLYDANHQKIAENDDIPFNGNDADLATVLPADGTYYIRVTDCWVWTAESGKQCAKPQQKTHTAYALYLYEKNASQLNVVEDPLPDPGNTPASATPLKFEKVPNSKYYYRTYLYGFYDDATDVDWFSFTLPADTPVANGRLTAYLTPMRSGTTHDGSTEATGLLTVTDATGKTIVAQLNVASGGIFEVPVTAGAPYLVSFARNDGLVGSNDFFVGFFRGAGSNVLEKNDAANGTMAGAEALVEVPQASGGASDFVSADLTPAGIDVDYYVASIPANLPAGSTVAAGCSGWYFGSGVRGLTATLLDENGVTLGAGTELQGVSAYVPKVTLPAGASSVYLKVNGASQDPKVTGTYYACGVYFLPP